MPTDYAQIARENEGKYGTEIDNYGPKLLADRYSDPTHFVFELLQNAEDALGERLDLAGRSTLPRAAKFILFKDRLEFRHFGIPFAENHIRAICDIARSSKQKTPGAIGHFGIGFKSVYAFTRRPEVHSGDESFAIESLVRPMAIARQLTADGETLFLLPFNHTETSPTECHRIIAERLRELGPRTLLFLRRLDEIDWRIEGARSGRYLRESKNETEGVEHITLIGEERGRPTMKEHWLVFSRGVDGENGVPGTVEIAYQLQQTNEKRRRQIRRTKDSPLCVYFATDLQTNLGFLVQGPFHLTQNRDNIRREDRWNKALAKEIGRLTADSLSKLKGMGLLSIAALDAMPLEKEKFETETGKLFLPVYEAVLQALTKHPLIPGLSKRWVSGNSGFLVRGRELTDLFTREQIQTLYGCEELPDWISPDITADKAHTSGLHRYIRDALDVDELDAEGLCLELDEDFMKERDAAWFARFYRFLLKHESLWIEGGGLRGKPIVRLADRSNVLPFGPDGAANAFLPTEGEIGAKTVHPKLAKGDALTFLQKLGIRERDAVAEVFESILPQYGSGEVPAERKHERNLGRIFRALGQKESPDHPVLIEKLKQTAFLRATNAKTGKQDFQSPSDLLYFKSLHLSDYFNGQSDAWFLAEPAASKREKTRERLAELGVADTPSLLNDWEGKEEVANRRRQKIEFRGRFESLTDYNIHGLENVLSRIRKLSNNAPKEARKLAKLLWSVLCLKANTGGGGSPFEGSLRWKKFRHKRTEEETVDAHFVELLREEAWLPDRKGHFRKPGEMQEQELPTGFERNQKLCGALKFQTPRAERLKQAGLAAEDVRWLELKERNPEAAAEFLRSCRKRSSLPPGAVSKLESDLGRKNADAESQTGSRTVPPSQPVPPTATEPEAAGSPLDETAHPSDQTRATDSETAANEEKGDGPARTDYLQTRVRVVAETASESTPESQKKSRLDIQTEKAGIAAVKAYEQQAGRTVTEMPHNHPGYDLESRGQSSEVLRYIEVKSKRADWDVVLVSKTQFPIAQELGDRYWLYVVENAASATPTIYPIQNPAGNTEKFVFDADWKEISSYQQQTEGSATRRQS